MPRVTVKELQETINMQARDLRRLSRKFKTERAENDKDRVHNAAVIMQLREVVRVEQDNVQSLRRLMNESRKAVTHSPYNSGGKYPDIPALIRGAKPPVPTHLL